MASTNLFWRGPTAGKYRAENARDKNTYKRLDHAKGANRVRAHAKDNQRKDY